MIINLNICEYKSGSRDQKSKSQILPVMLLQKNKKKFALISATIFTILGLTLKSYPVNSQKPESAIQNQTDINLVLQVGAFLKETNATVFKEKLAALIDKQVIMVIEEEFYKVQLTGFKNIEEIEKIIPALGLIGIKDFWIPPAKKDRVVPDNADLQPDTILQPLAEKVVNPVLSGKADSIVIEETPDEAGNKYSLEIGSFRKENRALYAQV